MKPLAVVPRLLRIAKVVLGLSLLLAIAAGGFLLWAAGGESAEEQAPWLVLATEDFEGATVDAADEGTGPDVPETTPAQLTVLSWNMAYGRGPKDDAGDLRDRATVEGYLSAIAAQIRASGADVVALQEVDFDANRTHHIDQLRYLAERTGHRYAARVTTWKNRYVPHPLWPPSQHYGAMHSGQAVLSRYPIVRNARHRYPQPAAFAFWYKWFYLHRATQVVDIQVGERVVTLLNTHLEAFDQTNRELQAELLVELLRRERRPQLLLAGDFNAPPAEATRKTGFVDEPEMDFTTDRTLAVVRAGVGPEMDEVVTREGHAAGEGATVTFPAEAPTRQLDYLFFGKGFALREGGVWGRQDPPSDHLPVRAVFGWTGPPPPRPEAQGATSR